MSDWKKETLPQQFIINVFDSEEDLKANIEKLPNSTDTIISVALVKTE